MTTENQNKSGRLAFPDTIPSEYGFITIDREFVNWPLFHDDAAWKMMCYLLMRANYKTHFWGTRTINPGEYVTSYAHIGEDLHKSRDEVKRLLTKLKNIGEVKTMRLGNALLVSMPNYLKYQRFRTRRHKDSARPEPDISPEPELQALTTKENKPGNNFKRKENYTRRQSFSNPDNGGFVSLGAIFARQMEPPGKNITLTPFLRTERKWNCMSKIIIWILTWIISLSTTSEPVGVTGNTKSWAVGILPYTDWLIKAYIFNR